MPHDPVPSSRLQALRALRDHPALVHILPSLPPRTLTRLYDAVGMNDAGSLMAATPPPLLARALDEAVWTTRTHRTTFDPDVFVDWLEVWLGEGDVFAAEHLLALDEDLLALCFAAILQVNDSSVDAIHRWAYDDGTETEIREGQLQPGPCSVILDRFVVTAAREDEWDVAHGALVALWDHSPDDLLRLLERLTADDSRLDGEERQPGFDQDMAGGRDERRERAGFVPPAAAQAFLAQARALPAHELMAMTGYDPETARHLRALASAPSASGTNSEPSPGADTKPEASPAGGAGDVPQPSAEIWSLLSAAGVIDSPVPAGLLSGPRSGPDPVLRRRLDALARIDVDAVARCGSELAYLANVLLTAIELPGSERSSEERARELAFACASLGVELLEGGGAKIDLATPPGLVRPFLVAWRTLGDVPAQVLRAFEQAFSAPAMIRHLSSRAWLRTQMEESLDDLRHAVSAGQHDAAREAVGLLSLAFDVDGCRAAAHLLDLPPRFPGLLEGGGRDAARWVQSVGDLEQVAALLRGLGPKKA